MKFTASICPAVPCAGSAREFWPQGAAPGLEGPRVSLSAAASRPPHCVPVFCSLQMAFPLRVGTPFLLWKSEPHAGTKQCRWRTQPSCSQNL